MILEAVKKGCEVLSVLIAASTCNQDVVQVDEEEVQVLEDGVHESLERLGGILKPEGHAEELKEAKRGDDCGLRDVLRVDWDLVVPTDEVHFAEDALAGEVGREVMDSGYWVPVILTLAVELPVITTRSVARAIGLGHNMNWR